ncbi:MAG TPA: GNAT family N-acetyltransferase [Thermomicrobiales bacterium]|nr:GNAT family N-acetyltransferase [Thermomicrobiales bacterium]
MHLREAVLSDYPAIRDLLHDSDAYHAQHAPEVARLPDAPRFNRDELAELLANDNCLVVVAEHENAAVGFIEASVRLPERSDEAGIPWCGINNLVVASQWRRKGVGRRLVEAAEEWARRKQLVQARLEVFEFNDGARALYEMLGYHTLSSQLVKSLSDER